MQRHKTFKSPNYEHAIMPNAQTIDDRLGAHGHGIGARQALMRICANATQAELEAALQHLDPALVVTDVRPTESGLVMLRGRIGGSGAPFNVGEATVTRAVVRLGTGEAGFSYLLGRSKTRARLAAILDAAGQNPTYRSQIEQHLVRPVTSRLDNERQIEREEAAANSGRVLHACAWRGLGAWARWL